MNGGNAVLAANSTFNSACCDVVNQLVDKFANEGAKSDYGSPPFVEISIKINVADRAQIYPPAMRALFDDHQQKNNPDGEQDQTICENICPLKTSPKENILAPFYPHLTAKFYFSYLYIGESYQIY